MPTSTGTADRGRLRRGKARGFTLVELMVVLTILALAATAVVLTIPGEERSVRSEADRLAARLAAARDVVRLLWRPALESGAGKSKHPKSALQEWAAGNQRRPPQYELIDRSGPDHAARFTVRVKVHKVGEAQATANSKQEAEKEAAREFMERYG